jgi:hypothetical protein
MKIKYKLFYMDEKLNITSIKLKHSPLFKRVAKQLFQNKSLLIFYLLKDEKGPTSR